VGINPYRIRVMGLVADLISPPLIYLHVAVDVSRVLKDIICKPLSYSTPLKISLNNQDKVENAKSTHSAVVKKRC